MDLRAHATLRQRTSRHAWLSTRRPQRTSPGFPMHNLTRECMVLQLYQLHHCYRVTSIGPPSVSKARVLSLSLLCWRRNNLAHILVVSIHEETAQSVGAEPNLQHRTGLHLTTNAVSALLLCCEQSQHLHHARHRYRHHHQQQPVSRPPSQTPVRVPLAQP